MLYSTIEMQAQQQGITISPQEEQVLLIPSATALRIDRWIADWLLEKISLSNSDDTYTTYDTILADYRAALQMKELDLDRFDRLDDLYNGPKSQVLPHFSCSAINRNGEQRA